jgi:ABC-type sulfate transport system substrate-binding protein
LAEAYLHYLYSPEAQEIAAENFYRPTDHAVAAKYRDRFPDIPLVTVDQAFGGWQEAQRKHFADGGIFDQIYRPGQ